MSDGAVAGTGSAGAEGVAGPAGLARLPGLDAPVWPANRNGRTPVRLTFFAHSVAAIDTDPAASPNCASIAAWLEGIRPYCQVLALGGLISKVSLPWTPNSATRLAAWNAPQTYRHSAGSVPVAVRCSRTLVHMYRSRSSSTRTSCGFPGASRRNRLPIRNMTCR